MELVGGEGQGHILPMWCWSVLPAASHMYFMCKSAGTTSGYVEGSADMAFNVQIGPDVQLSEPEFLTLLKDEQVMD